MEGGTGRERRGDYPKHWSGALAKRWLTGNQQSRGVCKGLGCSWAWAPRPAGQEGGVRQVGVDSWGTKCQAEGWAGPCRQWQPVGRIVTDVGLFLGRVIC